MGVDLSQTIAAKSDQLNADDLLGGPITVRVTRVVGMNDKEQPIAVHYDGDNGKPYKPGKSMRRVLVNFWGKDGEGYVGRWLVLYRDPEVAFGGIKVGGIRIGAMSDIDGDDSMALAVTRGAKRRYDVKLYRPPEGQGNGGRRRMTTAEQVDAYADALAKIESLSDLAEYQADPARVKWRDKIKESEPERFEVIVGLERARFEAISGGAGQDDDASDDDRQDSDPPVEDDDDDTFPGDR